MIYHYSIVTGEYLNSSPDKFDPISQDPVYPAFSVATAPPSAAQNEVACYLNGEWKLVPDYRNEVYYRTDTQEIINGFLLGIEPDPVLHTQEVPGENSVWDGQGWVDDMATLLANKIIELNAACEAKIISGFDSVALGSSYTYQSDRDDQLNLIGVVASGVDQVFKCQDSNGDWDYRPHTIEQLTVVLNDGATRKTSLIIECSTLKAQAAAATTKAELDAIVWTME
jgi:hypothetical protein